MPLWTLLVWLLIGGLAGVVAGIIMKQDPPFGRIGDVALGILGAIVGGYGLSLFGGSIGGGILGTFIVAVIGACFLLWAARLLKKA